LKVYTTLDYELQKKAIQALRRGITAIAKRHNYIDPQQPPYFEVARVIKIEKNGILAKLGKRVIRINAEGNSTSTTDDIIRVWRDENGQYHQWKYTGLEGAILSVDLSTMGIIAMVGGYDFSITKFNRTYQARRQPGSAFKPIVYTAALESGYTPFTTVLDAPVLYERPETDNATEKYWIPRNYEGDYLGPIPLWKALALSRNTVSVRLADSIGISKVIQVARTLGITSPLRRDLSLALGSSEVTLWELLRAYTVFAKEGNLCEFRYITKVVDPEGKVLYKNDAPVCINVLDSKMLRLKYLCRGRS